MVLQALALGQGLLILSKTIQDNPSRVGGQLAQVELALGLHHKFAWVASALLLSIRTIDFSP